MAEEFNDLMVLSFLKAIEESNTIHFESNMSEQQKYVELKGVMERAKNLLFENKDVVFKEIVVEPKT